MILQHPRRGPLRWLKFTHAGPFRKGSSRLIYPVPPVINTFFSDPIACEPRSTVYNFAYNPVPHPWIVCEQPTIPLNTPFWTTRGQPAPTWRAAPSTSPFPRQVHPSATGFAPQSPPFHFQPRHPLRQFIHIVCPIINPLKSFEVYTYIVLEKVTPNRRSVFTKSTVSKVSI